MGINFKLAYDGLKRNRRDTLTILLLGIITFATLISITNLTATYSYVNGKKKLQESGKWVYYQDSVSVEDCNKVIDSNDEVVTVENLGIATYGESYNVISLSANFKQLVNTKILEGNYPKDGEIAVSTTLLSSLGYNGGIGEVVTIKYQDNNGQEQSITATLSGIILKEKILAETHSVAMTGLDNSAQEIKFGGIILPPQNISNDYVSVFVYDKRLITTDVNEYYNILAEKLSNITLFEATINNSCYGMMTGDQFNNNIFFLATFIVSLLITLILMLGVTFSSLERQTREFTLLRAIGQTKKQMLKMLLFKLLLVVMISLVFGILLAVLVSYGGLLLFRVFVLKTATLIINYKMFLGMIIVGIIIIFLGMFIPSYRASNKSLSGTFEDNKFKYFSVRYKKLYYQNVFRLAKREFFKNIKLNLILIIVLAITFNSVNSLIVAYKNYDANLDKYHQALEANDIIIYSYIDGLEREEITSLEHSGDHVDYSQKYFESDEGYSWLNIHNSDLLNKANLVETVQTKKVANFYTSYYSFEKDSKTLKEISKYVEGRMPEKDSEVVLYLPYYQTKDDTVELGTKRDDYEQTIKIGTELNVYEKWMNFEEEVKNQQNQINYEVVGIIRELPDNNLIEFSLLSLIVTQNELRRKCIDDESFFMEGYNNIYIKSNDRVLTLARINQFNHEKNLTIIDSQKQYQIDEISLKKVYDQSVLVALLTVAVTLFLFAYLARYRIINYIPIIGTLKSLGITKRQIYCLYGCQAVMICLGSVILAGWSILYTYYLKIEWSYPFSIYILLITIISMIITIIYCLPLKKILNYDILKMIKIRE